jgi:cobalt-zinc-cadmium efflux system membrane fusion protein
MEIKMTQKILYIAIIVFASCQSAPKEEAIAEKKTGEPPSLMLTPAQVRNAGIEIGEMQLRKLSDEIVVNGVVDVPPQNIVSVSFPMGGYLKSTTLLPGLHVNKGDVMGVMEDQSLVQLQQDYLIGKEKLRYIEQEYQRQKELNENNVNAAKVYQQATTDYNSQKVMMKAMAEKLRLIHINPDKLSTDNLSRSVPLYSPINGYVSKVLVNTGKYVQPSDVLFELIDPSDIHAALTVFQKDVSRVAVGQEVELNFINDPAKKFRARIFLKTRNLDENRSETVHCHFIDQPKNLQPGMFLQSRIKTSPREVMSVPEGAVVNHLGKSYVFTSGSEGKFDMVEVQTGSKENGFIEIRNADSIKGLLVTQNAYALLGAMKNVGGE